MKRSFDLVVALALLALLAPVLAAVAILVRVLLGAPVFFRQRRPGLGGVPFELIKFRTMSHAADRRGDLLPDGQRLEIGRAHV